MTDIGGIFPADEDESTKSHAEVEAEPTSESR